MPSPARHYDEPAPGISQRAVMGLMGWSDNTMTTRYQHLTPDLRRDIAHQVDELFWTADESTNGFHTTETRKFGE